MDRIPWMLKYRPSKLADIALPDNIRSSLELFMKSGSNRHLVIAGGSGTGKTTIAICIASQILTDEEKSTNYLNLNIPEYRGTKKATSILTPFCRRQITGNMHKVIMVDEADNMANECQENVASAMKMYGSQVTFLFTCNDLSKISESIQSMSYTTYLPPIEHDVCKSVLYKICKKQGLKCSDDAMNLVCDTAGGDMRRAINELQKLCAHDDGCNKIIDYDRALTRCNLPDPKQILKIIHACKIGKLRNAIRYMSAVMKDGYYHTDIIESFLRIVDQMDDDYIQIDVRMSILVIIQNTKLETSQGRGARSSLQFQSMLCKIYTVCKVD